MGAVTGISWCDSTFNPWIGCTKVSQGCAHCYAERESKRWGKDLWGQRATRQVTGETYWQQPMRWQEQAERTGRGRRVFCGSMCDVFEKHPAVEDARASLWWTISNTPDLTWLLLTKRPENIESLWPIGGLPQNVWLGVSAENQATFEERVPILVEIPGLVRFLSAEPLLGPIEMGDLALSLDWVIAGGESGPKCRPMQLEWARSLRDQCSEVATTFFFKQMGGWPDKRSNPAGWPEDLRLQEFPA